MKLLANRKGAQSAEKKNDTMYDTDVFSAGAQQAGHS